MKTQFIEIRLRPKSSAESVRFLTASLVLFIFSGGNVELTARSETTIQSIDDAIELLELAARSKGTSGSFTDLTDLSLEELTNIRVTSVSKKSARWLI